VKTPCRLLVAAVFAVVLSACAGVAPPPPEPVPAPAEPAGEPVAEELRLELQAARVLLDSGRPRAAARAADELLVRLSLGPLAPDPLGRAFADEVTALWSAAHALARLSPDPLPPEAGPAPEPWWDEGDLAREEVRRWRDFFLGEGAAGLRRWMDQANPYRPEILAVLREQEVPPELWVLTLLESGLSMQARNPSGAVGPWQFVPGTAKYLGLLITAHRDQRRDWKAATEAACRYLTELKEELGDGLLALAAFNCGPGRVRRDISREGTRSFWDLGLPPETRAYVPRALALASILGTGDEVPALAEGSHDLAYEVVTLPHPVRVTDLARVAGTDPESLRVLNPALLLDVTPADGHEVRVRVPAGSAQQVLASLRDGGLPEVQPPPAKRYHRVRSGDTLWDLARKYRTTVGALRRANGLRQGAVLRLGQRLEIPG
jgi:soluble lytic murein transglycosylase-like protein